MKSIKALKKMVPATVLSMLLATPQLWAQTENTPGNWSTYNRNYEGDRYSPLTQITPANAAKLKQVAVFDLGTDINSFQTGPVVIDGKMYFTTDTATYAINGANGKLLWKSTRSNNKTKGYGANRGVAYLDGKLFRGTSDAHVLAYDAETGKTLWDVVPDRADQPGKVFSMSPVAYDGVLYIGTAGGDQVGVVGDIYAIDAKDGHTIWHFVSVPDYKGNPKTSTGLPLTGGGYWTSFGLDIKDGVLYASCGNPAPDMDIEFRGEDRKYFNHLLALDIKSGKVIGYNKLVSNDIHDWDVSAAPVIFTSKSGRQFVASANKNGLMTILDRSQITSGQDAAETLPFIYEVPTTTRLNMDVRLSREQSVYFKPGYLGGNEWNGPAYDPKNDVLFTGADDWGATAKLPSLKDAKSNVPKDGDVWFGPAELKLDDPSKASGWLKAFNVKDGSVKWQYHAKAPFVSAVTPTASGLLLTAGMDGKVYAFNANTGAILWNAETKLLNGGGVVTYLVNNKQYIAVVAGMKSSLWYGTPKNSKVFIYSL